MNIILSSVFILILCLLLLLLLALIVYFYLAYYRRWFPFQPPAAYPPREFYIQDQVIVTGRQADVEAAVGQVGGGVRLVRLDRLNFADFGTRLDSCPGLPHGPGVGQNLVIDQYRITGLLASVERAIQILNGISNTISPEPNWLTGDPWVPEGSPWVPEGSPWVPEGSSDHKPDQAAPAEAFMDQWAFRNIGLFDVPGNLTGAGVRVGIFDTSPFEGVTPDAPTTHTLNLAQNPAALVVNLLHPTPSARPEPSTKPPIDVRNHGLFSAGLVHAVAPGAEVHLVRVLENDNRGDLFTLLKAIFNFMLETARMVPQPPAAINLSLGIRVPPEEARFGLPAAVLALQYLMNAARCLGMVSVAAAGNESPNRPLPEPANLPARWATTIGVAASNIDNGRACFSNQGDLAAPGGEGNHRDPKGPCVPFTSQCSDGSCPFGVVGPVLEPQDQAGYIFWTGSSFSAPMVTGLAALLLQAGGGSYTPAQVRDLIVCGATPTGDPFLGAGVIHVRRTLTECLRSRPPQTPQQQPPVELKD